MSSHSIVRRNNHIKNHLFSESYQYDGEYDVETKILLTQYNARILEWKKIENDTPSFQELIDPYCINWFRITGLQDAKTIGRILHELELHPVDNKAVLTPCHAARIDDEQGRVIMVLRPCFYESKRAVTSEHICIIVKGNVIVSFRERGLLSMDNVMKSLRENVMGVRESDPAMLVAFMLNAVISTMIGTAIKVEEMLENIDNILLEAESTSLNIGRQIEQCRHANLIIQKNTIPLRKEFKKLLDTDLVRTNPATHPLYTEIYNQLDYLLLTSENSKELLSSMRDLYVSNTDLKTNTIVKRLTLVSTLFIPVTFLVGFWGMNFKRMPELEWPYGYLFAMIVLGATIGGTWYYMKRHNWF